jgi:hypothetical protein
VWCGSEGEGADPRSVRSSGRGEWASMRMCAERRSSPEDAGSSFVAVWELVQPKLWCVVCVVWERGEGAETQDPLDASRYGCVRGDHRSEHRFEACGDTIAGKGGVKAGIKPSKGGCCRSSCDRAAAQRIYGVLGGSGHTSRSPKCTYTALNK